MDIYTRDPTRLEPGETERCVHTALSLENGDLLDAEGARTFAGLCLDFGMDPVLCDCRPARELSPDTESREGKLIRRLADACGWQTGAPIASEIQTVTDAWDKAVDEFEERGGMNSQPERLLVQYLEEITEMSE